MDTVDYVGLTKQQAEEVLRRVGENRIDQGSSTSLLRLFLAQYKNIITFILCIAAAFSFGIGEYVDTFFIVFVMVINGFFGFLQDYRAEQALEEIKNLTATMVQVIREGEVTEIESSLLVPDDIVVLLEGVKICADGVLLSAIPIEIDEAIFTGESHPVEKNKKDEVFSGTFVVRGRGFMKVTRTGYNTQVGGIAKKMETIKRPLTPLAKNLDALGKMLIYGALTLSLLLFLIGFLQHRNIEDLVLTVVSLSVAVIPEGLPLVVTAALAIGAYRMAHRKTIVRKMAAIETLGSTNIVLADKTGTLTQNKMSVKDCWIPNESVQPLFLRSLVVGNTATIVHEEGRRDFDVLGDKTDGALLEFLQKYKQDIDDFKEEGKVLREEPFDSETKMIKVEWEENGSRHLFVRGAPESIMRLLSEREKKSVEKKLNEYSKKGYRVIAFAQKDPKKHFVFLGLLAIYDPPRFEASETLEKARRAGIRVVMVTGDNPETARSIAEEIGLIKENELVVTADEIKNISDDELIQKLPVIRIFARMRPEEKLRLVQLYKKAGFVVAVTGDGVNDSLALAQAHIGIAMGKTGTDVAKEAADLIITDDNLDTVIKAVEEGRGIFDNIVKVVVFLISSNAVEFLTISFGIVFGLPVLLSATQILYVNLVSDGLPALALAVDTKRDGLLLRKPRNISEQIINKQRIKAIIKLIVPFYALLIALYMIFLTSFPLSVASFYLFSALVIGEMIILLIVRGSIRPVNRLLFLMIAIVIMLQLFIASNPFLRGLFS